MDKIHIIMAITQLPQVVLNNWVAWAFLSYPANIISSDNAHIGPATIGNEKPQQCMDDVMVEEQAANLWSPHPWQSRAHSWHGC